MGGRFGLGQVARVVARRVDVGAPRALDRHAQRVVDDAALDLVPAREAGEDREPRGVGGRPAGRAQPVRARGSRSRPSPRASRRRCGGAGRRARRAGRSRGRRGSRAGRRPRCGRPRSARRSGSDTGRGRTRPRTAKRTCDSALALPTTVIGMPIGPPSHVPGAEVGVDVQVQRRSRSRSRREFAATGSASTRLFQTFVAGKIRQSGAPGSGEPYAGAAANARTIETRSSARRPTCIIVGQASDPVTPGWKSERGRAA